MSASIMADAARQAVAAGEDPSDALAQAMGVLLGARQRPSIVIPKDGRAKVPHYLEFVRGLRCFRCDAPPRSDPHHFGTGGMGRKADDYRTVPACRRCHDAEHAGCVNREEILQAQVNTLVEYLRLVERR